MASRHVGRSALEHQRSEQNLPGVWRHKWALELSWLTVSGAATFKGYELRLW